jgi:phytoene/squalene synthetase
MELYTSTSFKMSKLLTQQYSTSFSLSSRLFGKDIQSHIYAIYGMVRIADEIVDTYRAKDAPRLLDAFEAEVYYSLETGYSTNPVVHAFVTTARLYAIPVDLIQPFFASMRVDLDRSTYDQVGYDAYIYGSAEVVGLMCLKVFCGDEAQYELLEPGARALGAAYQKVNFLRDIAADYNELGRLYFPGAVRFETFSEADKQAIIADIQNDFAKADEAIALLPSNSQSAVALSKRYYTALLERIQRTPVEGLKTQRVRVPSSQKIRLLVPYLPKLVGAR